MCIVSTALVLGGIGAAVGGTVGIGAITAGTGAALMGAGIGMGVGSAIDNAMAARKQAKTAGRLEETARAQAHTAGEIATQQEELYEKSYAPVVVKLGAESSRAVNAEAAASPAIAGLTDQASPVASSAVSGLAAMNASPNAIGAGASRVAASQATSEAEIRNRARLAADDIRFNRSLGFSATGRGIPGSVIQTHLSNAQSNYALSDAYSQAAGTSAKKAVSSLGSAFTALGGLK